MGKNVYVHILFIDFQAACDREWRKEIWSERHKLCFPKKLVKLCRTSSNEMYGNVKIGKHLSSEFKVNRGLRQGDALTPLLLNVVLEIAIVRSKVKTQGNIFANVFK
jgi:hypothetical protein